MYVGIPPLPPARYGGRRKNGRPLTAAPIEDAPHPPDYSPAITAPYPGKSGHPFPDISYEILYRLSGSKWEYMASGDRPSSGLEPGLATNMREKLNWLSNGLQSRRVWVRVPPLVPEYGGDRLVSLDSKTIVAIESVLSRGDRVELVPVKEGGVKVLRVKRRIIVESE